MKKILMVAGLIFIISGYCEVKKATIDEVKNSIKEVEKAVKESNENLIEIYSGALEIEKRATTPFLAEKIMKKICKTAGIKEKEFKKIREKHSFFDVSIGWAISQIIEIPLEKIMREKEGENWKGIINKYFSGENYCKREKIASKIIELNPRK
ncbi:hypothetical protein J7L87_02280 [bacterium]|nr:hypothetical protein [bacterium]